MIRATAVLLVAWLVIPRLRRRSAAERHLLWSVSLGAAAALPVLAAWMPAWEPAWARHFVDAWPARFADLRPVSEPDVIIRAIGIEPRGWGIGHWIAVIWIAGAIGTLLLLAGQALRLRRLVEAACPVTDGSCLRMARDLVALLRLSHVPAILESGRAVIPMTWGVLNSTVLLPAGAVTWPGDRLHAVLAHECAHVQRRDWLVHMLTHVACAIYWFHPLFWIARRQLCRESEQAADDDVLGLGLEPSSYAAHLLDVVRASRVVTSSYAPTMTMASRSHLEQRVDALLAIGNNRRPVTDRASMTVAAIGAAVVLPLAAITLQAGTVDVDIRTLGLPLVIFTTPDQDADPMLPAVRRATPGSASDAVVAPSIAEYTTPPLYSEQARRARLEGVVTIGVHVDGNGRLTGAHVVKAVGFGLDQNALVALRQWQFRPGTRNGKPEAMDAEIDIEFNLQSEAVNAMIANDMATLVGPGVTPPRVVRTADASAPRVHARGSVVLDAVLLEDGTPKIVRILQSLTPEADESAVRHFEQWRFTPAMKSGVPVKVRMNAEVRFHG